MFTRLTFKYEQETIHSSGRLMLRLQRVEKFADGSVYPRGETLSRNRTDNSLWSYVYIEVKPELPLVLLCENALTLKRHKVIPSSSGIQ